MRSYQSGDTKNTLRISGGNVRLVLAGDNDLELILAWRSHPEIFRFFRQQKGPLSWDEHINFWRNRKNRMDLIIEYLNSKQWRKVGTINFSKLDSKFPEVGILIGEITLQGKGIGQQALLLGLKFLTKQGYKKALAEINKKNTSSRGLFMKAGFKLLDQDKNRQWQHFVLST